MRCPPTMENPGSELAWSMDQDSPALVGRGSSTIRPWAVPAPPLCTVMPNPRGSVALTGVASAVLVMVTVAQLTTIPTGPTEAEPSLEVVTEAELFTVPQVAEVVGEVMWTWVLAPPARSAGPKCSAPEEMVHPELDPPASMDQLRPALVGRVSVTVTPLAVPTPVLDTVTT